MAKPLTVLSDEQIAQVEQLASVLTQEQLADFLGIAERTFRDIMGRDERVSAAYKKGRASAISGVGQNLLQKAMGGDTASAIFYLKTQAGWREKEPQEEPTRHIIEFVSADSPPQDPAD